MYCRRCKKDNVGGFHKCFNSLLTKNAIIPLDKPPDETKRISYRLLERLKEQKSLVIKEEASIERLYPGHWQRSAGAWLWYIKNNFPFEIGSCYTMKECLESKYLDIYVNKFSQCEISPMDDVKKGILK